MNKIRIQALSVAIFLADLTTAQLDADSGDSWNLNADADVSLYSKSVGRDPRIVDPIGMATNLSCATNTNLCPRGNRKLWAIHNAMMWVAWTLLMMTIVASARWFRQYWRRSIYIHASIGIAIFLITTVGVMMAWTRNYKLHQYFMHWGKWSSLFENVATFLAWGICISGMVAWFYRRYGNYEWHTTQVLNIGKYHRYISQVFVIGIQGLIVFAIIDNFGFTRNWILVSIFQFLALAIIATFMELRHQRIMMEEVPYVTPRTVMTLHQFEDLLRQGRKLMILDDLVLDVGEFYKVHPGGKFVIEHTVGTDIAKFFYGGYSLEDNLKATPAFGFRHSNYARMIANDIAIARFECGADGSVVSGCRLRWDLDNVVNKATRSFVLETLDRKPRLNYKAYFPGTKNLTKHFWIRNMNNPAVIRHYTTCNAMAPRFYKELVRVLNDESQIATFDKSVLNSADANHMTFTIKNYKKEGGLSFRFFETDQRAEYQIKGPMGKGLAPASTGVHLAFAAGTGNLCFVDMMAHVALSVLGLTSQEDGQNGQIDPSKFELHLYASFPSKAEAVAWELCEALRGYCKRNDLRTFIFNERLSKEKINPARWDEKWVEAELRKFKDRKVERLWVCGPPMMNELFDRTLMDMRRRLPAAEMIDQFNIELL